MRVPRGLPTPVIAVGVAVLAAACASGSPGSSSLPTPSPSASPGASSTTGLTAAPSVVPPSPIPTPANGTVLVIGSGSYPTITVVLPAGWSNPGGHFILKYAVRGPVIGLSVWDVGQVPSDPCHWKTTLHSPGPGVDGLVKALLSQEGRHPSTPTKVELGGQSGQYLEWSVPDWVVTGDADFAGCDDPGNGHFDYVSWFATDSKGERYEQVSGQVDQLWVINVHGTRLVVDATYTPGTTSADRAELADVVASLRFAP
jgi:hypothetical protein